VPQTASASPLLISIEEAGRLLGQSRSAIYGLIRRGRLPVVKLGASARIPRSAVESLVDELLAEGAPDNESPVTGEATRLSNSARQGRRDTA
jgi:excisionase family DNA binding protein